MALIKCPEFGNDVSDKAPNCLHCGCPLNSALQEPNKERKFNRKSIVKLVIVVVSTVVVVLGALTLIGKYNEEKERQAYQTQLEAEQQAYQDMIEKSKENIVPYLKYIGEHYEAGEKISLPSDLYNNIEDVEFMGMRGKIEFGTTATSKKDDYYVRYCSWESFDGFSEEEFQSIAEDLNNYFGCEADVDSRHYYSGSHTHRYYWTDPHSGFHTTYGHGLFMYHTDGSIEIIWATEFCEGADFFGF